MHKVKQVIIFGTNGTATDIVDTVREINRVAKRRMFACMGFLDDDPKHRSMVYGGVRVLGTLKHASDYTKSYFVNAIGSTNNYWKRETIIRSTHVPLDRFVTLVHPTASISRTATLGKGTVILQHVTVASNARVENHVVVLPSSIISHDAVIGDYTCIAGGVSVSGRVHVGKACYLGTNASIIGDARIGDYSLIGMGAVVVKDVPPKTVMVGNPARRLRSVTEVSR